MKKRKGRLTPIKKLIQNSKGKIFDRIYWVNLYKSRLKSKDTLQHSIVTTFKVSDFIKSVKTIAKSKVTDKHVYQFTDIIVKKISPDLNSVTFTKLNKEKGVYYTKGHLIELDDSIKQSLKTVLFIAAKKYKGLKLIDKVNGDFSSEKTKVVRDFVGDIGVVLHEAIHSISGGYKDYTSSFEEGSTELISILFTKQFFNYLTQNTIKLEDLISEKVGPDGFLMGMAISHPYAPFIHRIVTLLNYLGLSPKDGVESLIDFKVRNKEEVCCSQFSFVGFLKYLKQKFPSNNKLKYVDLDSINAIIEKRRKMYGLGIIVNTSLSYEKNHGIYAKDDTGSSLITICQYLDSAIDDDKLFERLSIMLKESKSDVRSAIKGFLSYIQDTPLHLTSDFEDYFSGSKFNSSIMYLRKMIQYSQEKYSFKDFLNFVKWRKQNG